MKQFEERVTLVAHENKQMLDEKEEEIHQLCEWVELAKQSENSLVPEMKEEEHKKNVTVNQLLHKWQSLLNDTQATKDNTTKIRQAMAAEITKLMDAGKEVECLNEDLAANPVTVMKSVMELIAEESVAKKPWLEEKHEFNYNGELLVPVNEYNNNFEGLTYLYDVKGSVRDKIANSTFVLMGDMVHDTDLSENLQRVERTNQGHLLQNVLPPPPNIKSKLELFQQLFLFGSFYLQKFPHKMASFFDYLLYLMKQADMLTVAGLVHMDHLMHHDFAANPDWNWAQHRAMSSKTQNRVILKDEYKISTYKPSIKIQKESAPSHKMSAKQSKGKKSATVSQAWNLQKLEQGKMQVFGLLAAPCL